MKKEEDKNNSKNKVDIKNQDDIARYL